MLLQAKRLPGAFMHGAQREQIHAKQKCRGCAVTVQASQHETPDFSIVECRCAGHGSVHTTCWLTSIFSWQGIGSQAFLRPARAFCWQPFAANSPKAQDYDQVVVLFYGVQMVDALGTQTVGGAWLMNVMLAGLWTAVVHWARRHQCANWEYLSASPALGKCLSQAMANLGRFGFLENA